LISLALCTELPATETAAAESEFYAEFADLDSRGCDAWVREHVIPQTRWLATGAQRLDRQEGGRRLVFDDRSAVSRALRDWLGQWPRVEIWGDCPAYDWVLFCELFGGARRLPAGVGYIPLDLATALALSGHDPDIDRRVFAGIGSGDNAHNALDDARTLRACHRRLQAESAQTG
jgi:hypothetical protein